MIYYFLLIALEELFLKLKLDEKLELQKIEVHTKKF